ncbi:MAG: Nif3-like dinuclear metal center hexameric protein [Oscillospiraceae bacterium]|nr:Nif3-like dinuclear metal center hexameric protein [Oscillospiraceae bacterium]
MISVEDILNALWALAPVSYKETWDNVGLLLGRKHAPVRGVLVALDATAAVAAEAERLGCQLVVTHHPVIFRGDKHVTDDDPLTAAHLDFLEKGIAVISMHTNLDCAPGGVNDVLAERLGLQNCAVLEDGETAGLIRMGELPETTLPAFAAFVKSQLNCPGLRYVEGGRPVRRVAVGGGACGEYVSKVLAAGCDTLVTADIKYHEFCDAATLGLNLIDAGHFETEDPVCDLLIAKLQAAFPGLALHRSKHADCIRFL